MRFRLFTVLVFILAGLGAAPARAESVWWEAEDASETNFPAPSQNPFAPENPQQAAMLSGGHWIGFQGPRDRPLFAEYKVTVKTAGTYRLFSRKFWKHGPFRWRFAADEFRGVDDSIHLLDTVELRKFICANWVSLGTVELKPGTHTFRIESTTNDGAIAFDAFVLSSAPFSPRGPLRPDQPSPPAPAGWFNFEPPKDRSPEDQSLEDEDGSPIDLRYLNEKFAGENGFIRTKGESFIHEKTGLPVRFWGVNMGPDLWAMDKVDVDYLARWLAKRGVNLVRLHGSMFKSDAPGAGTFEPEKLERLQYVVAALKREGIYTSLSIYFPLWLNLNESDGWPGYKGQHPFAILFFDPKFQTMYRGWWEKILTSPNPHTGVALKDEPALMYLELLNEDSFFFWTFTPHENVPKEQMRSLEERFAQWAGAKYGSAENAMKKWNDEGQKGDAARDNRLGLVGPWRLANRRDLRSQDTARFLFETQTAFYRDTQKWLQETIGARQIVTASNWTTASQKYLEPLEKLSYDVNDFMDRHGYFGGIHQGERAGYSVSVGDKFSDRAAVRFDGEKPGDARAFGTPLFDTGLFDKPTMISEIDFLEPGRFRAEMPFIAATFGAMQDMDAIGFFALSSPAWQPTISKFAQQTPAVMGQFPAAALIYRKGLVDVAPVVTDINYNAESLLKLEGGPQAGSQSLDQLRKQDIPAGALVESPSGEFDPRAYVVGRVMVRQSDAPTSVRTADLSKFIDDAGKVIRTADGQVTWDYGRGVVTLNAKRSAGAVGFLGAHGVIKAGPIEINIKSEFASVLLVPLDDKPLTESKRLLLQVMTEHRNSGWTTTGAADGIQTITEIGQSPLQVRNIEGTISLRALNVSNVTRLDLSGQRIEEANEAVPPQPIDVFTLDPHTLYYLIEK